MTFGSGVKVVDSDEEVLNAIHNSDRENQLVIDLDNRSNGHKTTRILTDYNNGGKSSDALAIAIDEEISRYGLYSEVYCGQGVVGGREEGYLESLLSETPAKGIIISFPREQEYSEIENNTFATIITNAVAKYSALSKEEQDLDIIRRVEAGDNLSSLEQAGLKRIGLLRK